MASYQYSYVMKDVRKVYPGGREILKGLTLSFLPTAKIGVLGVNGAGKSTLLKIMAGKDKDFTGEAWAAEGVRIGYLEQEPQLDPALTVEENVVAGLGEIKALLDRFNELSAKFAEPMSDDEMNALLAEQGELQEKIDAVNGWELDRTIEIAMDALRCPPGDADVTKLSGGERRRVALCRLLLQKPEVPLLDEPTNHLDAESVAWLERFLADYDGTVMIVTHDRYFLDNVTGWILELDRGQGIPYEGNYSSWLEQKQKRLGQEGREEAARMRTIAQEREWISASPRARQAKSKARIKAYEELLQQAGDSSVDTAQIVIPAGPRLGDLVIEADHVRKGFGNKLLIDDLSFKLPPGGIVGIIGANGAGKTTLFRIITGQEQPDGGEMRIAESVKLAYVEQSRDAMNDKEPVWSVIADGQETFRLGNQDVNARAYAASFSFTGSDQQQPVGTLSGGQRNRVHLALMLKAGANVILLDEPTNDLDVNTMRALEDALENFAGCAVVISHDRWFLDRLATHILAFEGDSKTHWYEGNFSAYEADRKRRLGAEADQPHRVKYRTLKR